MSDLMEPEYTALEEAVKKGDSPEVDIQLKALQKCKGDFAITPRDLTRALRNAVRYEHPIVVDQLLKHGAIVDETHLPSRKSPEIKLAMFQTFHKNGWDLNSKLISDKPAIWQSMKNERVVRWFLENGADANFGAPGVTLLDVAAGNSTTQVFDLLVAHGAKKESSDALHTAASQFEEDEDDALRLLDMVKHLLGLGFDPNAMSRRHYPPGRKVGRRTPLHAAMRTERTDRIEVLLRHGANPELKDSLGRTPLEYAMLNDMQESVDFLRAYLRNS